MSMNTLDYANKEGKGELNIPLYLQNFQLSDKSLEDRKSKIGGSEINVLASGDEQKIDTLDKTKRGLLEQTSLTTNWAVMMGCASEDINLAWFELKNQVKIINQQKVITSKKHSFMRCTLDGSIDGWRGKHAVLDAKFTLGFPKAEESYQDVIPRLVKYYTPQLHWNGYLLEEHLGKSVTYGLLSIIRGGSEPQFHEIKLDKEYTKHLIKIAEDFVHCVENDLPYKIPDMVLPPIPYEEKKPFDMTKSKNSLEWKRNSEIYLQTYGAKQSNVEAEKKLKKIVPKIANLCFGNGIKITVSKNNRKKIEADIGTSN